MGKSNISLIKHGFFNNSYSYKKSFSFKKDDFDLDQLRIEFSSLYQLFLSNKQYWSSCIEIVIYMNYICDLMISYYQTDYVHSELEKLKKQKKEIDTFVTKHFIYENQVSITKFPVFLLDRLKRTLHECQSAMTEISKLRDDISSLNTNRARFSSSRAVANYLIVSLQKSSFSNFIHEINVVLGNQSSFVDGLNLLEESREALASMSIALFAFRFTINLAMMCKHVLSAFLHEDLSANKVLKQELEKRGFTMASDLAWSVVSLLTGFNQFFYVSPSAVSPIILSFLVFDILMLLAQWFFEATKYNARLKEFLVQKEGGTVLEQAIIQRQIDILNDEWEVQSISYPINILAATILVAAFTVTMLSTASITLAGSAFFSLIGNALYNSAGEYKKYQQSKIAIKREMSNGLIANSLHHEKLLTLLHKELHQNNIQFWNDLAFNICGFTFIITAAVASWPIALGLTMAYIGYQLNKTYQKQLIQQSSEEIPHDLYRLITVKA